MNEIGDRYITFPDKVNEGKKPERYNASVRLTGMKKALLFAVFLSLSLVVTAPLMASAAIDDATEAQIKEQFLQCNAQAEQQFYDQTEGDYQQYDSRFEQIYQQLGSDTVNAWGNENDSDRQHALSDANRRYNDDLMSAKTDLNHALQDARNQRSHARNDCSDQKFQAERQARQQSYNSSQSSYHYSSYQYSSYSSYHYSSYQYSSYSSYHYSSYHPYSSSSSSYYGYNGCTSNDQCGYGTVCSVMYGECNTYCPPGQFCSDICRGSCVPPRYSSSSSSQSSGGHYGYGDGSCTASYQCDPGTVCSVIYGDCSQSCPPGQQCSGECHGSCVQPRFGSCNPYVCNDGTQFPSCAYDGSQIQYFMEPCTNHGGDRVY